MTAPRFDRGAERDAIGSVLLAGALGPESGWKVLDRAVSAGLQAGHFYDRTNALLWSELVRLRVAEIPLDAVTVSSELGHAVEERVGALAELVEVDVANVRCRLHALAAEAVCFGTIEARARVLIREAERRATEVL